MTPKPRDQESLKQALAHVFISPNESDRNFEAANVVDALFAIARAIEHLAEAMKIHGTPHA